MASGASYVYILSELPKMINSGHTVLPDRSILIGQKLGEKAKITYSNDTFLEIFKQCASIDLQWSEF